MAAGIEGSLWMMKLPHIAVCMARRGARVSRVYISNVRGEKEIRYKGEKDYETHS